MKRLAATVLALVLAALAAGAGRLLLGAAPEPVAPPALLERPATPASAPALAPAPIEAPTADEIRELEGLLGRGEARAAELADDAETLLETVMTRAAAWRLVALAERAKAARARFRAARRAVALEVLLEATAAARRFARDAAPCGLGRYREAIAAAREAGEPVAALEDELRALRAELGRRARIAGFERERTRKDPATEDTDASVRELLARLARGDLAAAEDLVKRLLERARLAQESRDDDAAFEAIALARSVVSTARSLGEVARLARWDALLDGRERACRLELGGVAIQRGDGPVALERLDLAALTRVDGAAPANPRILYLLGRAFEADANPEAARRHFLAAIGSPSWLPTDAPAELLRWLARQAALRRSVSARSAGVGPGWHRVERPRFTLFHETPSGPLTISRRIEGARKAALARLAFPEPSRRESKTVLFVFASPERYRESGDSPRGWAVGHASRDVLEDGPGATIVVSEANPGDSQTLENVLVHEWAHTLVGEHLEGARLPNWVAEGVASWAEDEPQRAANLAWARRRRPRLVRWRDFLLAWRDGRYASDSARFAADFYAQSLVGFDFLVGKKGSAASALAAVAAVRPPFKLVPERIGLEKEEKDDATQKELEALLGP